MKLKLDWVDVFPFPKYQITEVALLFNVVNCTESGEQPVVGDAEAVA